MNQKVIVAGVGMIPFTKPGASEPYHVMGEKAVRQAMLAAEIDSPRGYFKIDPKDGNIIQNIYITKVIKRADGGMTGGVHTFGAKCQSCPPWLSHVPAPLWKTISSWARPCGGVSETRHTLAATWVIACDGKTCAQPS